MKKRIRFNYFKLSSLKDTIPKCGEDLLKVHRRSKRWAQLGDKVWIGMPVTINYKQYHSNFTRKEQDDVLQHCVNVSTLTVSTYTVLCKCKYILLYLLIQHCVNVSTSTISTYTALCECKYIYCIYLYNIV